MILKDVTLILCDKKKNDFHMCKIKKEVSREVFVHDVRNVQMFIPRDEWVEEMDITVSGVRDEYTGMIAWIGTKERRATCLLGLEERFIENALLPLRKSLQESVKKGEIEEIDAFFEIEGARQDLKEGDEDLNCILGDDIKMLEEYLFSKRTKKLS